MAKCRLDCRRSYFRVLVAAVCTLILLLGVNYDIKHLTQYQRLSSLAYIRNASSSFMRSQLVNREKAPLHCILDSNRTSKLLLGNTSYGEVAQEHPDMQSGEVWSPQNGQPPNWTIAIIVPIRDREEHLKVFLRNMIPFLKCQNTSFRIFAIEQIGKEMFNKAQTMDAGFVEVQKLGSFDCFIFHDVDMLPINMHNHYSCRKDGVRHLGISIDLSHPQLLYWPIIGGASAFTKTQFEQINGFTTIFFGWGGEDDDGFYRETEEHIQLFRDKPEVGNYYSLNHVKKNRKNFPSVWRNGLEARNWMYRKYDGLNTLTYNLQNITQHEVYTRIVIYIPGPKTPAEVTKFQRAKEEELKNLYDKDQNSTSTTYK